MQCEQFRKAAAADPSVSGDDFAAHAAECDDCAAFRDELRALNEDIARALAIAAPEFVMPELPSVRAAQDKVVDLQGSPAGKPPAWWRRPSVLTGIAAGLAVFVLVSLLRPGVDGTHMTLAEEVIAHMDHEQASRQVTTVAVPEQALDAVVAPRVSDLGSGFGLVSYAASCVIGGNTVPHLVVQGESGPLTLILLPEEEVDRPIPLNGVHVHGLILPVGSGSIAIIGEREDQLGEVEETGRQVAASIRWRI